MAVPTLAISVPSSKRAVMPVDSRRRFIHLPALDVVSRFVSREISFEQVQSRRRRDQTNVAPAELNENSRFI